MNIESTKAGHVIQRKRSSNDGNEADVGVGCFRHEQLSILKHNVAEVGFKYLLQLLSNCMNTTRGKNGNNG